MRYQGEENPVSFLSCVNPLATRMSYHIFLSYTTPCFALINPFKKKIYCRFSCFLPSPILGLLPIPWLSLAVNSSSSYPHQKPGQGLPQHSRVARGEHLCLPGCWHRVGPFEFQCNVYMESSGSTEKMHLAPHFKSLPHALSRFHTLFHITGDDKRGRM